MCVSKSIFNDSKNLSKIVLLVLVESFFMHNGVKFKNHFDVIVEHTH